MYVCMYVCMCVCKYKNAKCEESFCAEVKTKLIQGCNRKQYIQVQCAYTCTLLAGISKTKLCCCLVDGNFMLVVNSAT